jgi:hypothetical protein
MVLLLFFLFCMAAVLAWLRIEPTWLHITFFDFDFHEADAI